MTLMKQFHKQAIDALHNNCPKEALRILESMYLFEKPKRKLTAYQFFIDKRLESYKTNPHYLNKSSQECRRAAIQEWKDLTPEEQRHYKYLADLYQKKPELETHPKGSYSPSHYSDDDHDRTVDLLYDS